MYHWYVKWNERITIKSYIGGEGGGKLYGGETNLAEKPRNKLSRIINNINCVELKVH